MLRESDDQELKKYYYSKYQDLNRDFIFFNNAFNVRNTEIGGLLGTAQLSRLNSDIIKRTKNFKLFLSILDKKIFFTNFKVEGSSNYAFNLILIEKDDNLIKRLINKFKAEGVEFRRGSAGVETN